jgi:hypothetical protein
MNNGRMNDGRTTSNTNAMTGINVQIIYYGLVGFDSHVMDALTMIDE